MSIATPADYAACRAAIRQGSRSFYAASKLLPMRLRDPAYALYAFCRLSDDAVDMPGASRDAVGLLRARLDALYAGDPMDAAADRALADTVRAYDMPRDLLDALLEGLEWDRDGRDYETISDLRAYGARVAGTVGAMMAVLMGARSDWMLARACDLGVAMQLTNIARDIGEDGRNGRIYAPRDWLREEGVDPNALLGNPTFTPELGRVTERLLEEAERLYMRSESGIARLPLACRPAIWAARLIYADIGREIAQQGHDSVTQRAVTSKGRKIALLGRALSLSGVPMGEDHSPALGETEFLVDAAAREDVPEVAAWRLDEGIVRVIDVLDRVQKRKLDAAPSTIGADRAI